MDDGGAQPRTILVVGNANLDVILGHVDEWPERGTESFYRHADLRIGGSAANTAIVLQRLGASSGLVSAHGSDFSGAAIGQVFSGQLDQIAALPGPTGFTVGLLHLPSERTFFSATGHLDQLDFAFFEQALASAELENALVLLSGGFAMPSLVDDHLKLQTWLRDRGAEVAIDPGWPDGDWTAQELDYARSWAAACEHLLVNDKEAAAMAGTGDPDAMMDQLAALMPSRGTVVIKRGPDGATARTDDQTVDMPAQPLDPIDTVGAGDAFNAGYLAALARSKPLEERVGDAIAVAHAVLSEFPRSNAPLASSIRSETP